MIIKKNQGVSNITLIILFFVVIVLAGGIFLLYNNWQNLQNPVVISYDKPENILSSRTLEQAALAKRLIDPNEVNLNDITVKAAIPGYNLPLNSSKINNLGDVKSKLNIGNEADELLLKNGFAVMATPASIGTSSDDFAAFYSQLKDKDMPLFITSDSLLHYYHIFFDTTLMKMEKELFYDYLWQMSQELYADNLNIYNNSQGDIKEAAKQNVAYLAVAMELLKPKPDQQAVQNNQQEDSFGLGDVATKESFSKFSAEDMAKYQFEVPDFVKDQVAAEIDLIEKHEGWKNSPLFIYQEDYSQYVPRGHYTKSEKLKNYFKAMMWYGRMTALINGSADLNKGQAECSKLASGGIISETDAKIQTMQAVLIARKFGEQQSLQDLWQKMYAITGFFVGFSDDLGPYEYIQAINKALGSNFALNDIEKKYPEIKAALNNLTYNPKIYSGLGACSVISDKCPPLSDADWQDLQSQARTNLAATKGFRLMGQRFTIDSYYFSELVAPYSGVYLGNKEDNVFTKVEPKVDECPPPVIDIRGFPTGLDIMALLGSDRAKGILTETKDDNYSEYEKVFGKFKGEVDSFTKEDWTQNLYWNWLYVLKGLNRSYGAGYQPFMQTQAWLDKDLHTSLSSWAELRHDTILYVKQSYTGIMMELSGMAFYTPPPPIRGYVEPVPEFYNRLLNMNKMTQMGLRKLLSEEELQNVNIDQNLTKFNEVIQQLLDISLKELNNSKLSEKEYDFIKNFGDTSASLISGLFTDEVDPNIFNTVLVADVHTDGNTEQVLEEGVGYIKTILAAYKMPDNRILVGVGPVFSYYEFKQPMSDRLTDEKWRTMLQSGKYPAQPEWTKSFIK